MRSEAPGEPSGFCRAANHTLTRSQRGCKLLFHGRKARGPDKPRRVSLRVNLSALASAALLVAPTLLAKDPLTKRLRRSCARNMFFKAIILPTGFARRTTSTQCYFRWVKRCSSGSRKTKCICAIPKATRRNASTESCRCDQAGREGSE
jgi:hypothetical protein